MVSLLKLANFRYLGQKASVIEPGNESRLLVRISEDGFVLAFISICFKIYFNYALFSLLNFIRFYLIIKVTFKSIIPLIKSIRFYIIKNYKIRIKAWIKTIVESRDSTKTSLNKSHPSKSSRRFTNVSRNLLITPSMQKQLWLKSNFINTENSVSLFLITALESLKCKN